MRRSVIAGLAATLAATPLVVMSNAAPAEAYCFKGIGRWKYHDYTLHVRTSIPSSWNSSVKNAMKRWNGIRGSNLKYYGPTFRSGVANPEFQLTKFDFQDAGLPDVPGYAAGSTVTPRHSTTAVSLNSRFHWNTTGQMSQSRRIVDVWTVAVHEMGHASGLAHPWATGCGPMSAAEKAGVMNVTWTKKRYPNSDDKAGIAKRY